MHFSTFAGLLALNSLAAAVTVNLSGYSDSTSCSGAPSFNQLIGENTCNNAPIRSLRIFQGDGDSNGCFVETYQDSNCAVYASRIGPLGGGNSGCVGQGNPNTGELQQNFSFRLLCN